MAQDSRSDSGYIHASSSAFELNSSQEGKPLFPFLDLEAQFELIRDEVLAAVHRVMNSQRFILGPEVESFEEEIAAHVGARAAISCASGSDALLLALMALGIGPGDEVITSPFTFVATAGSVARLGANPVLVDIHPETFNLDPAQVEAVSTGRTRAVIPVHLFGLPADMDSLLPIAAKHGWAVIEDAAQAINATYEGKQAGTLGLIGCFSFYPSKNLGGAGDGGLITTNDPDLAQRLRILRNHGSSERYRYQVLGINSRLDAVQAAVLRVKLRYLDEWTRARCLKAERYCSLFSDMRLVDSVQLPFAPVHCGHVYNQFTIRCQERDHVREFLRQRGIPTEIYYPLSLHLQPAFAYLGYKPGAFPASEAASREVLSLPIYPELKDEHQVAAVRAIASAYSG
jgi:dTDP-4-amino-4,6-dideoxygalactose transaminase